jgi:hypothetical protein
MIQNNKEKTSSTSCSYLVLGFAQTDFADLLRETDQFIRNNPQLLKEIEEDLNAHGCAKKQMRLQDRQWRKRKNKSLYEEERFEREIQKEELDLTQGRPRTSPYVVLLLLVMRGYTDGTGTRSFQDLVYESRSLQVLLHQRGEDLPAPKTAWELVGAVTNKTRQKIHEAQCEEIINQGLDDFSQIYLDSTDVEANSAWPTDGTIILKLIERVWRDGNKLEEFGLDNFQRHWTETWIKKIKEEVYKIKTANHKAKRKKAYKRIYDFAGKAREHLEGERSEFESSVEPEELRPTRREQLEEIRDRIRDDLDDISKVISYSSKRVMEGKSTSSTKKVLSTSDPDAAFIIKGDREPTIGYRPQVGRSEEGFIGNFHLPEGNAGDAPQLVEMVEQWEENTGKRPDVVSTDDGYADQENVKKLREKKEIDTVSISGAKGKRILGEEVYQREAYRKARRKRSSVESTFFVIQKLYGFGRASRRGKEAVEGELLEDVIAHNFIQMGEVRRRKQEEKEEPKKSRAG